MNTEESTITETDQAQVPAPDPQARALVGCRGVPVTLADGQTWLLHEGGLLNLLDGLRDELYDGAAIDGKVMMGLVFQSARHMLQGNYNLEELEVYTLLLGLDQAGQQALTDGVMRALFGDPEAPKTYTMWAASALIANGIDPTTIATSMIRPVLTQLVATKRAVSSEEFIESASAAKRIAGFRDYARQQAQTRTDAERNAREANGEAPAAAAG